MKPSRHLRHPARPPQFVQPAIAACALLLALGWPCREAAANVVGPPTSAGGIDAPVANAGALNVTPPAALDEEETAADAAAAPPAASVFEDVLRDQDPAEVPLSLALMGGVLGILYVGRRKR
jgi:hypothetical protein